MIVSLSLSRKLSVTLINYDSLMSDLRCLNKKQDIFCL